MKELIADFGGLDLLTLPTSGAGDRACARVHSDGDPHGPSLPGLSGLDALDVLKRNDATKAIPVIALTAAGSERDRQRGLRAGFHRYFPKPVDVDELNAALAEVFSNKQ